jgi:hypothetical protein
VTYEQLETLACTQQVDAALLAYYRFGSAKPIRPTPRSLGVALDVYETVKGNRSPFGELHRLDADLRAAMVLVHQHARVLGDSIPKPLQERIGRHGLWIFLAQIDRNPRGCTTVSF